MGETANGQHDNVGRPASDAQASDAQETAARSRRFQALALPHLDAAYNLARWLSRNPGDAEDIVQDAFLRAFRFFDTFRGDEARPWLLAIVRRVWYDEWRRRAGSQEVAQFDELRDDVAPEGWDTGESGVDPETLAIRAESSRHVHEALQRLPAEYREVLVLRELEELEYREIATVIDVPMGTVMSRLARARKRLAAMLAAQGHGAGARAGRGERRRGNENDDLAVGGSSSKAWRPSGRGPDGRFREEPAVDGGAHEVNEARAQECPDGPHVGPHNTEAPDEL
ncbi:RNA polymerase sigma-70 factor (ECF subfamily) [Paraburkholderia bannensis]|uniref:RNA polymerase sigma factor n=1 Tax=Paraburkholderia bannensis TaxID=765414 RepID=A0A7W9WVB0_9BURK|nr:RNA polymerase sigma-70 factor (ECF subfamily) [Paraburkholderia sp. WP4_3_2]MBB6104683.1 RNA polymerase sigma-70 factor (ECF subfamily) [Paraburkholderia bannensis]